MTRVCQVTNGLTAGRLLLAICLLASLSSCADPRDERAAPAPAQVAGVLGGDAPDADGFARVTGPRPLVFPDDHGPHPDYRHEWWYFTGNLRAADGRRFGYQLTIFRIALAPQAAPRASAWAFNQLYMAHFALTDVAAGRFHAFERFARGALGLAGAQAQPFRVWLEDWRIAGAGDDMFPLALVATQDGVAIALNLARDRGYVLQGDNGYSRKSADPGNASYYYSATRLVTGGTVTVDGRTVDVSGTSWLDREWSTSALGPEQAGWDWFALQLDDGRDLMYYRLRNKDGSASEFSAGMLLAPDGAIEKLGANDVVLEELAHWRSPRTGTRYPSRWRLRLPAHALSLDIAPVIADQELDLSVRYWEGAVSVVGAVGGAGYVELAGY